MIRLDGNSLAAFRGAGVAGTVQSVAGCELFGAAREPLWASPYSAAATAALKAQFPDKWNDIMDYGFRNPNMVPWINEDPMLVCSVVEGLGVWRMIKGNGHYITLGDYDWGNISYDVDAWSNLTDEVDTQIIGGSAWSYSTWITQIYIGAMCNTMCDGSTRYPLSRKHILMNQENNIVTIEDRVKPRTATFTGVKTVYLLGAGNSKLFQGGVCKVKIQSNLVLNENADFFVPFLTSGGIVELLNLRTGTYATKSGTLEIAYCDSQYNPWSPA